MTSTRFSRWSAGCVLLCFLLLGPAPLLARTIYLWCNSNSTTCETGEHVQFPGDVSESGGIVTVTVDTLDSPYTLGTLQFRDNSGTFEQSTDSGTTWTPLGSSTMQYGLEGDGTGTLAQATVSDTTLGAKFFHASAWQVGFVVTKDDKAELGALLDLENQSYSATRAIWRINSSNQPEFVRGYNLGTTPATETLTCTDAALSSAIERAIDTATPFLVEFAWTGSNLLCAINGDSGAAVTMSSSFDTVQQGSDAVTLGSSWDGAILWAYVMDVDLLTASTTQPIRKEGIVPHGTWQLPMNNFNASSVSDCLVSTTLPAVDLTITNGSWVSFANGY